MDKNEVENVLVSTFRQRADSLPSPTVNDWAALRSYFGATQLCDEFVFFMELAGRFRIEGELLRVADGRCLQGVDTIVSAVEAEKGISGWPGSLIPFYSVGNGDYYCVSTEPAGAVVYLDHEGGSHKVLWKSFSEFLKEGLVDLV